MQIVKAYAHFALRVLIGATLVAYGGWALWHFFEPALRYRQLGLNFIDIYKGVFLLARNGAPLLAGILVLRWRARGLVAAYCLAAGLLDFVRPDFPAPRIFIAAFLLATCVFLVLPTPRMPVLNPPAEPDEKNWHRFLLASLQGEGIRPVRDRFTKRFLTISIRVGAALVMLAIAVVVGTPLLLAGAPKLLVLPVLAAIVFGWRGLGRFLHRKLQDYGGSRYRRFSLGFAQAQMQSRTAEEELRRSSSRKPILYLRAFAIDDRANDEQAIVKALRKVGPVIAIGRPNEEFPPLGAARFYVDHDHWQTKVADIVKVAQLVVWVTGTTEGLRWELNHLRQSLPPGRLILWAHPHLLGLYGKAAEEEWGRFLAVLGGIFPFPLPADLGDTRFFIFHDDWQPVRIIAKASGSVAQVAALNRLLDYKGIRKMSSRRVVTLKVFGLRAVYFATLAAILGAVAMRIFFGH